MEDQFILIDSGSPSGSATSDSTKYWTHEQILYLISIYKKFLPKFDSSGTRHAALWQQIHGEFSLTYPAQFNIEQVKTKISNLKRSFYGVKSNANKTGAKPKYFRYYNEMFEALGDRIAEPVSVASNLLKRTRCDENDSDEDSSRDSTPVKRSKSVQEKILDELKTQRQERSRMHAENIEVKKALIELLKKQ